MVFKAATELKADTGIITLAGELDANVAPDFRSEIEKVAEAGVHRLVLVMSDLEYMASAGLRVLIFAKQKLGQDVELILAGTHGPVMDTVTATGFDRSVTLIDDFDASALDAS